MSEQVLPLPLSGGEIIKSVLHHIEQMLRKDCFLNEVAAYETVQGVIGIRLAMKDCGRECPVELSIPLQAGPSVDESDPDVYLAQADRELMAAPPNQVRQESDQPLPVLVEDSTGKREVKRVTYARPPKHRAMDPGRLMARGAARAAAVATPAVETPEMDDPESDESEVGEVL